MHEILVNRLGLSLPRKSVVRLTDRPDITLDDYRGRKTTIQKQQYNNNNHIEFCLVINLTMGGNRAVTWPPELLLLGMLVLLPPLIPGSSKYLLPTEKVNFLH